MIVRYIVTRPSMPKEPRETKNGLSHAKAQDTTAQKYQRVCKDYGIEPNAETLDHLKARDLNAWAVKLDIFSGQDKQSAAIKDAIATTAMMRALADTSSGLPPRNAWSCDRCDWREHCAGDPTGASVSRWFGAVKASPASPIEARNVSGMGWRELNRESAGRVVSPSELRSFMTCPRKWSLEYVERMRPRDRKWSTMGARIRGIITHAFFEVMLEDWQRMHRPWHPPSWEWPARAFSDTMNLEDEKAARIADRYFDRISPVIDRCIGDLDPNDPDGLRELRACLPACAKAASDAVALATEDLDMIVGVESTRAIKLPGVSRWVFGTVDDISRRGDQLVLIELKTTKSTNLDAVAERYRNNVAVDLYAAMIEHGREARRGKKC